jgi:hypothetical protein
LVLSQIKKGAGVMEKNMELFVPTYHVDLLSDKIQTFNVEKILESLRESCGNTRLEANTPDFLVFAFEDYAIETKDKKDCPQCVIIKKDHNLNNEKINEAMQQTWDWSDKEEVIKQCSHKVVFSDFLASELDCGTRLKLFNNALAAVLKNTSFLAINWLNSLKLVSPNNYLSALYSQEVQDYLYGALNVRLYVMDEMANEFLMDTFGLAAFGLPDLQCHFKDLNPEDVAGVLINYGYYIFEKGDVILDGHTVQGITSEQKWSCQHVFSMVEPRRIVLDFNPGEPYGIVKRVDD